MVHKLRGAQQLRQRLLYATLAGVTLRIDDIRSSDENPGLRDYEASFLRLLEKVSDGCVIEINETGTRLRYKPGTIIGGKGHVHECSLSRAIGYFLEPLLILCLFGKRPLSILLRGITNDDKDLSVDTLRTTTLPLLKHFGVPTEELELKVQKRGAPPLGGGEVLLKVPIIQALTPVFWLEEGLVKRIRGVAYSTRVSPQMANRMVDSARGVLNKILPDVYIFTDHFSGQESGKSPGYGISLVAETTTGCLLSSEKAAEKRPQEEEGLTGQLLPEDIGKLAAIQLLQEIQRGGVVDSSHQGLVALLCALCPEDVCKVRIGALSPHAVRCLRDIKELLGVQFTFRTEEDTGTVLLSCVGRGHKNLNRRVS